MLMNAAHIGLPVPEPLKNALAQLHGRGDKDDKDDTTDNKQTTEQK